MLAEYDKIVETLQRTKTKEACVAQQELKELIVDNVQVLVCLHNVLRDNKLEQHTKVIAASYINEAICQNGTEYRQSFMFEYLSGIFDDSAVSLKAKRILNRGLSSAVDITDYQTLCLWKDFVIKRLCQTEPAPAAFLVVSVLAASSVPQDIIYDIIEKTFDQSLSAIACCNQQQIDFDNWCLFSYTIEAWKNIVDLLIHYDSQQANQCIERMANCDNLWRAVYTIYESFADPNFYLIFSDNDLLSIESVQRMVDVKQQTSLLHKKIFKRMALSRKITQLMQATGTSIEKVINTLHIAALIPQKVQDFGYEEIVDNFLEMLRVFFTMIPEAFANTWKSLLHCIVFPFLRTNPAQLELFSDDPQSFMQLFNDCCEQQNFGTIKTEAAQFLQKMVDCSTRVATDTHIGNYIRHFALMSIKHHLQMLPNCHAKQEAFEYLEFETSFMVLSILSYDLSDNMEFQEQMRIVLCNQRLSKLPPLQLCRVLMFLSYNYTELFTADAIGHYWVELSLDLCNAHNLCVEYCALDFVFNILETYFSPSILQKVTEKVINVTSENFWHILKKIIKHHIHKFSLSQMVTLIEKLSVRVDNELRVLQCSKIKHTFVIINICHVLRSVMSFEHFVQENQSVKSLIWSICAKMYRSARLCDFEDEVILILNYFLKYGTTEQLNSQSVLYFLKELLTLLREEEFPSIHLFQAINQFIMKSNDQSIALQIHQILKDKLGILITLLTTTHQAANLKQKTTAAYILVLTQNLLVKFGGCLSLQQISSLYNSIKCLYPQSVDSGHPKIVDKTLLARGLNTQYICSILQPYCQSQPDETYQKICEYAPLNIYYNYDVKVLISCMKLQMQQNNISQISKMMSILTSIVFMYLSRVHRQKQLQQKYLQENQTNSSTKIYITKINNFELLVNRIRTPFSDTRSARAQFRDLIFEMHRTNQALFTAIVTGMTAELRTNLRKAMGKCGNELINTVQIPQSQSMPVNRTIFKIASVRHSIQFDAKEESDDFQGIDQGDDIDRHKRRRNRGHEQFEQQQSADELPAVINKLRKRVRKQSST